MLTNKNDPMAIIGSFCYADVSKSFYLPFFVFWCILKESIFTYNGGIK